MLTTPAFDLVREQQIPEVNSLARLYVHRKTGAEILSLINDDENKVFGIVFKTPPEDSTGVAHILEHSVLCGSRKYPVKKPFVELLKGSLHTFLNAMTYPDKTAYPVASTNLQDFHNLVDVYLDAVLFPLITEDTFRQEGWHYELEGGNAPLQFKGVVFNEMKGAYSSPAAILGKASQQSLYPDNTYGVDSGGDPKNIPDLTYEYFRNFHSKYYHPSNARIVFYGDDDPDERLNILERYLGQFSRIAVDAPIVPQKRWSAPRKVSQSYAASAEEAQKPSAMIALNWMLDEETDPRVQLAAQVLEHILVGTPAAPLRKALTDSGLGEGLTGSGLADDYRQPMFTVGLKGIDAQNADKIEALILDTLKSLADKGIDKATVEASMNTAEFSLRENNTGSFPRGMSLMFRSLRTWLHGGDPLKPLEFENELAAIKADLGAGVPVFENLIREYLLDNPHRTTVLLTPDAELAARDAAEERKRLDDVRAGLDAAGVKAVEETTRKLKALQEAVDPPEALAKIPTLTLKDLPPRNKTVPVEVDELAGTRLLYHDLPTSGIIYLDLAFDFHGLPADLLPYLPLFSRMLLQAGTSKEDFVSMSQRIGRSTGGIAPHVAVNAKPGGRGTSANLVIRGKAVPERAVELLAILTDVLLDARLDNQQRFVQMALETKAGFESSLTGRGNGIVSSRLKAALNESDWVGEQLGGVSHLFFIRELIKEAQSNWPAVQHKLEAIRALIVTRGGLVANVTADRGIWGGFRPQLEGFLGGLPNTPVEAVTWQMGAPVSEGLTIPAQVNFVAKGGDLRKLGFEPSAAWQVAVRHLNTTYLWDKVRVQGGAYGGGSSIDLFPALFNYSSYRDPNLLGTLEVYDGAAEFLRQGIGETDLVRSIIGVIGTYDRYMLPDAKGHFSLMQHLTGDTDEARQARREQVLGAAVKDFHALADGLAAIAKSGHVVVMGSEKAIGDANAERDGFLTVTKVL